jgi:Uma2 family endonuclease
VSVTAVPPSRSAAPPDTGVRPRRWTRKEYYRAAQLGLFRADERLELLDGEIIAKLTQNPPHAVTMVLAGQILSQAFGPAHHVRSQLPLILNNQSEPEPDFVVVRGTARDYLPEHPRAVDVVLVVEVADTTLRFDRNRKLVAYARARIAEYWILNLPQRTLEVYREPSRSRHRSALAYSEQAVVTPLAAPDASIRVTDLLPPPAAPEQG